MRLVIQPQDVITRWVFERTGGQWVSGGSSGLGVADGDVLVAAAAFTDFNGVNVSVHIAVERPAAALPLFTHIGGYAFGQLGCRRLTLVAESSNLKAVKLHEKLGAIREGTLVGAGRSGDDILISRLTSDSKIWRRLNGRKYKGWGSRHTDERAESVAASGAENSAATSSEHTVPV